MGDLLGPASVLDKTFRGLIFFRLYYRSVFFPFVSFLFIFRSSLVQIGFLVAFLLVPLSAVDSLEFFLAAVSWLSFFFHSALAFDVIVPHTPPTLFFPTPPFFYRSLGSVPFDRLLVVLWALSFLFWTPKLES